MVEFGKSVMKTAFKILSIFLLLTVGAVNAFANPAQRQEWRNELREIHEQQILERQDQAQPPRAGHRRTEFENAESSGPGAQGNASSSNAVVDDARRPGRMSPEDRRTLRRQINEAGRDIYAPRH